MLGVEEIPSKEVINCCVEFLCSLISTKHISANHPGELCWKKFKSLSSIQGVDKMSPTAGFYRQHVLRALLQSRIWCQDNVLHPKLPDQLKLGWAKDCDGHLNPILTDDPVPASSIAELVRCNCSTSNYAGRCKCKQNNLLCTELCECGADEDCCNINKTVTDV